MAKKPKSRRKNQIKAWRKFRNSMSQEQLAGRIEKSQETIARYERGDIDIPVSVLHALAEALDCSTDDILNRPPGTVDAIIETFRSLDPDTQKRALAVIKALKDSEAA